MRNTIEPFEPSGKMLAPPRLRIRRTKGQTSIFGSISLDRIEEQSVGEKSAGESWSSSVVARVRPPILEITISSTGSKVSREDIKDREMMMMVTRAH